MDGTTEEKNRKNYKGNTDLRQTSKKKDNEKGNRKKEKRKQT